MFKTHNIEDDIFDIAYSLNNKIFVVISAPNSIIKDKINQIKEQELNSEEIIRQEIECEGDWISVIYLFSASDSFDKNKLKKFFLKN